MDMYLHNGNTDAERYSALRVLCQYWGLWDAYLQYLFTKIEPDAWENDYALADEATNLLGRYLCSNGEDKSAWGKLVEVYDDAIAIDDSEKADTAYSAMFVALRGEQEKLRTQLSSNTTRDESVIRAAREMARLNSSTGDGNDAGPSWPDFRTCTVTCHQRFRAVRSGRQFIPGRCSGIRLDHEGLVGILS